MIMMNNLKIQDINLNVNYVDILIQWERKIILFIFIFRDRCKCCNNNHKINFKNNQ